MALLEACTDCGGELALGEELYDAIDDVVVSEQVCVACDRLYLVQRLPTRAEQQLAHHQRVPEDPCPPPPTSTPPAPRSPTRKRR